MQSAADARGAAPEVRGRRPARPVSAAGWSLHKTADLPAARYQDAPLSGAPAPAAGAANRYQSQVAHNRPWLPDGWKLDATTGPGPAALLLLLLLFAA